jgi:hypothetical protein
LLGGSANVWVLAGRVADERVQSVRFVTPSGGTIVRPLGAGGFYVAAISLAGQPLGGHCPPKGWRPIFVALDPNGEKLGEWRIPVLQSDVDGRGRVLSCGGSVTPIGPRGEQPPG